MNRYLLYLQYNLTHKQIALVINNYFKFDTATGKLVSQREQFCFCTYTYWHHLENLSYQIHAKLWALKSSCEGTFLTKQLSETIVVCSVLRVNLIEELEVPLFTNNSTSEITLPVFLNKTKFDESLLSAPLTLKEYITQYKQDKEIFDLKERHDMDELEKEFVTKNFPTRGSSFFIHFLWYHSKEQFS